MVSAVTNSKVLTQFGPHREGAIPAQSIPNKIPFEQCPNTPYDNPNPTFEPIRFGMSHQVPVSANPKRSNSMVPTIPPIIAFFQLIEMFFMIYDF